MAASLLRGSRYRRRRMSITSEEKKTYKRNRPDHDGTHRLAFERNKKKIFASERICGICGQPVDMSLKYPHPFSPSIDHIIPIDRGGHPSDISNLQLAHWKCNRNKANKLVFPVNGVNGDQDTTLVDNQNRNLPLSMDWSTYRGKDRPLPAGGQN